MYLEQEKKLCVSEVRDVISRGSVQGKGGGVVIKFLSVRSMESRRLLPVVDTNWCLPASKSTDA